MRSHQVRLFTQPGSKEDTLESEFLFYPQCFASMEADEQLAKSTFEWLGDGNIVFSTDYPHEDSVFPTAVDTLTKLNIAEDTIRKVLWDNCSRLYNIT